MAYRSTAVDDGCQRPAHAPILIDTGGDGEPRFKPEPKGRFGSTADERGHRRAGPLLEVKRTERVEKRMLALEVE